MTGTKAGILVLGVVTANTAYWTDEFITAACAVLGAVIAILYNYDFISEKKRVGWAVAAGSGIFPVLFTQAVMSYLGIEDFKIGNLLGLMTGLVAFGIVRFVLENQKGIAKQIVDAILKRGAPK